MLYYTLCVCCCYFLECSAICEVGRLSLSHVSGSSRDERYEYAISTTQMVITNCNRMGVDGRLTYVMFHMRASHLAKKHAQLCFPGSKNLAICLMNYVSGCLSLIWRFFPLGPRWLFLCVCP